MVVKPSDKVTLAKDLQPLKVPPSMVVMLGGIVILSRPDSLKPLIDNKVLGSSIFFRLLQPVKAPSPILFIRSGRVIEDNLLQLLNALFPMVCNSKGRDTEVNDVQRLKVEFCISTTFSGITMLSNLLQPSNAYSPSMPRPAGNSTEARLEPG